MKRGDSKTERLADNEPYMTNSLYYNQYMQYPQPQSSPNVNNNEFSSINVGVGDMERGQIEQQPKSLLGRLWHSYQPTVSGLTQNIASKMEAVGEYVADTIGITRPKYEWEVNEYFERQQGNY